MKYKSVYIESIVYILPEEAVPSAAIEARLGPLYERLQLSSGVLAGMSGIFERRFWAPNTRPSEISIQSVEKLISAAGINRSDVGALVHGSICRDFVEPATANLVHRGSGLARRCLAYDVSNACLGMLSGIIQVANMIELGQICAGIVVGTESSRELVDNTIELLNSDTSLTRTQINNLFASLTLGSANAAVLLTNRRLSTVGSRLLAVTSLTSSASVSRSRTDLDASITGKTPRYMETDSARLLEEGIAATVETLQVYLEEIGWSRHDIDRTICHQVGGRASKLLLNAMGIQPARDFARFDRLGNTGAVAIPLTMALADEVEFIAPGNRVVLVGTGAGINSCIAGIDWRGAITSSKCPCASSDADRVFARPAPLR